MKYFMRRVIRLLKWIPFIWKTHTWDWEYSFAILRKSLGELEETLRLHGCHVGVKRDVKNMQICLNLMDRIIADNYYEHVSFFTGKTLDIKWMMHKEDFDRRYLFSMLDKHMMHWWD